MNDRPRNKPAARPDSEEKRRDAARIRAELTYTDLGTDPFVAAVRATRMPMIVTNPREADNPVVFANDAFCRLTGYARVEILGRNCRFLQGPDTDPATVARIRAAVDAERSVEVDILNYRKSGETFWNRLLLAPVRDGDGVTAYFFASQVDVTIERERLEGLESHNTALTAELADRLQAQHESEARLRFAAEAGRLGIWDLDLASEELTASSVCKENFGFPRTATFAYSQLHETVHDEDRDRVKEMIAHCIATGADYDIEYRVTKPGGVVGWVEVRAQVLRAADGTPLRMAGISLDITGRKAAERRRLALVEIGDRIRDLEDPDDLAFASAEILGRTLGVSRAGYGTIDPVAETISMARDWNAPGIRSLAGLLRFRDYGSYIEDLKRGETVVFADAETDPRTAATADALKAISARSVVNMPVTEQGGFVALLYLNHAEARSWSTGELAFVREVADRVRTAVERRRAEQDLRRLAASLAQQVKDRTAERDDIWRLIPDLLMAGTLDGRFLAVNPAWTRVLGYTEAELRARPFWELIDPALIHLSAQAVETMRRGETARHTNRVRTAGGDYRWFDWVSAPAGNIFYAVARDITNEKARQAELEAAQEALRQSQKMEAVGQLTGGLAHDFNNLLTGISGSLELLQVRVAQGRLKDIDRYVAAAQGSAKRAAALTHRLLAFSRRQTLEPKPINVNRLIADMEELIRRTVGPGITVEVVGTAGLWSIQADPNQLENALLNLCINARDAMPEGGRLTIETANRWLDDRAGRERDLEPGQYLSLCVSDTGIGMTPEVIARAFDPFFTTKPLGLGTGLGLSMTYGFVRQSGGQARIYSEPGHGTVVCLYLPRHYGEEERFAAGDAAPDRAAAVEGETVLVVDDEPTVRMLVREVLEDLGYRTIEAGTGADGLRVLQSEARIDLLVTDVGLPGGMNGRQVTDAGRALRPGLKVLFITGYAENAVVGNGHLDPGMRVLTKPFAMDQLASRIQDLIGEA
ncbi:MAG TPA: PAS domain S-box protein [Lichenihabitans sp.]|jgi:PAS domain S-box-containing protein|nr:PAS domain S-box protein [Lichenihabitans sp.]